ncbi:hypothetical protein KJ603_01640 [Patescibacteria group bacterium]|nr:hypothetical protein [Patescibacteria group bacterium]
MSNNLKNNIFKFFSWLIILSIIFSYTFSNAADIEELKSKIIEKSSEMQKIEAEIQKWEQELEVVGNKKKTLNNEIYYLNTTEKKLKTNINLISS